MLKNGFQICESFGSESGGHGHTLCILQFTSLVRFIARVSSDFISRKSIINCLVLRMTVIFCSLMNVLRPLDNIHCLILILICIKNKTMDENKRW